MGNGCFSKKVPTSTSFGKQCPKGIVITPKTVKNLDRIPIITDNAETLSIMSFPDSIVDHKLRSACVPPLPPLHPIKMLRHAPRNRSPIVPQTPVKREISEDSSGVIKAAKMGIISHGQVGEQVYSIAMKAADEILAVGMERKTMNRAREMSQMLRQKVNNDEKSLLEYSVILYSESSFLFRALHRDLGDDYTEEEPKLYYYEKLLRQYIELYGKQYEGTVYRGAKLNDAQKNQCAAVSCNRAWCFNTFLSTSKSREVALLFGNTLLIIHITSECTGDKKAVDITDISAIADEQEVLLTPEFTIFKTEEEPKYDPELKKFIVNFTSTSLPSISPTPQIAKGRRSQRNRCTEDLFQWCYADSEDSFSQHGADAASQNKNGF